MHRSVVPRGVRVILGLSKPPRRGCGEPAKPRLKSRVYPLVWIPCCATFCLGSRVTPSFKDKTRCSSNVCPGSSFHIYSQNVNTENQCLYYINIITRDIVFTQKTISTLSSNSSRTHPFHRQSTGATQAS
jgi:hypothetical protein